jgi:hypothetical protein
MARTVRATMMVEGLVVASGYTVKAGQLVGFSGGEVVPALGVAGSVVPARGVALTSGKGGQAIAMGLRGEVSGVGAPAAAGADAYVSEINEGEVQAAAPTGAGSWQQSVGWAPVASGDRVALTFQDEGAVS